MQKVLCRHTEKKHARLVWDTFTGHLTDDIADEFQKRNITVTTIPGGCTSKVQPLDACLNKPFKINCLTQWVEYMQQQVTQQEPGERIIKPASKQQVVDWVVQSNKLLDSKRNIICRTFLVCGISNALNGSQNHFIRCAKELPEMSVTYRLEANSESDSDSDDPFTSGSESESEDDQ